MMAIGAADWLLSEKVAKRNAEAGSEANAMRETMANAPNIAQVIKSGAEAAKIASEIPNPAEPSFPLLPAPA
jgi:hypothetical protein